MPQPSEPAESNRPSIGRRPVDHTITLLGVLVLVATYVEVEATAPWYPTWLYLGEVTLPTGLFPPLVLALAVIVRTFDDHQRRGAVARGAILEALLASLVVLMAGYAIIHLNLATPGVFWAGIPPMLLGVLLALLVLARGVHRIIARD